MSRVTGNGTPLDGDRSAFDAESFPLVHANDIDVPSGLHHTLGIGSGNASTGNHVHANDHVAVTISDTATLDLALTGQALSGSVIPSGIKLDDLGTPDDNTDLDATISLHGLMSKADKIAHGTHVVGPASAVSGNAAIFNGTTGKLIKDNEIINTVFEIIPASGGTISEITIGPTTYVLHTFTAAGTFVPSGGASLVDVLVVGGGGGARGKVNGWPGGGGGGQVTYQQNVPVASFGGSAAVVVGTGGVYGTGVSGLQSSFGSLYVGSGGGAGWLNGSQGGHGGTSGNGLYTGGLGWPSNSPAGGGAGDSENGENATSTVGGQGGDGTANSITGASVYYGGGGGTTNTGTRHDGLGTGTNTGGGGWGYNNGWDGIVIIRYEKPSAYLNNSVTLNGSTEIEGGLHVLHGDVQFEGTTEPNMLFLDESADKLYLGGTTDGMTVNKGGDVIFIGSGSGLAYGSFYGNELSSTYAVNNSYARIADTGCVTGEVNLVTYTDAGTTLTITKAGKYKIDWSVSCESSVANTHVLGGIMINSTTVLQAAGQNHFEQTAAGRQLAISGTAIISCPNGTEVIGVGVGSDANVTLTVDHVNLSILQVGG